VATDTRPPTPAPEVPSRPRSTAGRPARPTARQRVLGSPLLWPLLALGVLLVVNVVATPSFLDVRLQDGNLYGSLVDIARNGAPVLLVALGMTLVIATRGIDLSVGAVAAISGAVACTYIVGSPQEAGLATALVACSTALGVCVLLGLWNGFLVSVLGIQPIIATLVLMVAGRGLAMLVTDGQITTVDNEAFSALASGFVLAVPVAIVVAVGVFALTAVLTRRTALGMLIEAVGINPEASRLAGVRSRTIVWTVYVFAAVCAGLAGLIIAANTSSVNANSLGLWIELDAILAVVIGGTSLAGGRFSLTGTLVGALFIATLARTIPNIGIPSEANYLFKALVVVAVCLLQSPRLRGALRVRRTPRPSTPRTPTAPTAQTAKAGPA
jgi:ribose/xylose/arabinose/galactoside ABC-type transport system permease subunit